MAAAESNRDASGRVFSIAARWNQSAPDRPRIRRLAMRRLRGESGLIAANYTPARES